MGLLLLFFGLPPGIPPRKDLSAASQYAIIQPG
jgi:hypothetical protein